MRSWCVDDRKRIFRSKCWLSRVIEELRWRGIGRDCLRACFVCLIILLSCLRLECSYVALEENICWKLRTVNFLLGMCCSVAVIVLV